MGAVGTAIAIGFTIGVILSIWVIPQTLGRDSWREKFKIPKEVR